MLGTKVNVHSIALSLKSIAQTPKQW